MTRADAFAIFLALLIGPVLAYAFLGTSWPLWGWLALFVLHLIFSPPSRNPLP